MTDITPPRFLRLPEVLSRTGFRAPDSIYRLAKEGRFPRPVKLSSRASGWDSREIDAWIAARIAASRGAL